MVEFPPQKAAARVSRQVSNKLLAALPPAEYRRLRSVLDAIPLEAKHVLYRPGERAKVVCFPGQGIYSITKVMKSGRMVEIVTVGNEGLVGVPAIFGQDRMPAGVVVQVADPAARVMPVSIFEREMARPGPFARVIQRYASGFTAALMQLVACNALHSVEQRCARWLLMARDRVGRSQFPLTQERLATMLGVRRPTVTLAVGALQRRRLIRCGPGRVLVLDRSGLQAASCECYAAINQLLRSRR